MSRALLCRRGNRGMRAVEAKRRKQENKKILGVVGGRAWTWTLREEEGRKALPCLPGLWNKMDGCLDSWYGWRGRIKKPKNQNTRLQRRKRDMHYTTQRKCGNNKDLAAIACSPIPFFYLLNLLLFAHLFLNT